MLRHETEALGNPKCVGPVGRREWKGFWMAKRSDRRSSVRQLKELHAITVAELRVNSSLFQQSFNSGEYLRAAASATRLQLQMPVE